MRSLVYLAIATVFFWAGAVTAIAHRPAPPLVRVVHATPATYKPENCAEVARLCYQRKRSARIGETK